MDLSLAEAVDQLAAGGCVAYPTETVWGLAADATDPRAVDALRALKGRDDDAPISILVSGPERLPALGLVLGAAAARTAAHFWPGPVTLVLPPSPSRRGHSPGRRGCLAPGIARADGAVGVRCSPHPRAAALVAAAERAGLGPLTATSCNRSGRPPARDRGEAAAVCAGGPRLLDPEGRDADGAAPSTVVDFTGGSPRVLREGAVSEARLRALLPTGAAA